MAHDHSKLLALLSGEKSPSSSEFKELILALDNHRVLAKVFLLEGTPFVFEKSPMKYVVFREQIADRFDIGSQDVCIVGSAKLGFSPTHHKYGTLFSELSDVDVVIISEPLFYKGSRELFITLNSLGPSIAAVQAKSKSPSVDLQDWSRVKNSIRNFVYENLNPALLPHNHPLRITIFENVSSTSGLFLALEPQVFVSKIRCRIFKTWKAAEDYYANTLRETKLKFLNSHEELLEVDDDDDDLVVPPSADVHVSRK